ncbi:B12-binding domain-containing radical SAM protein [Ancylobacter oerskovii]|uniref:B12-binding domain-containing radical SAM protein n=1 Tax=Ancylobacter oerskovii TaxID=459519 RepID=A0ABW4Z1K1_9HYPH|nr:B12-binding domain-containing radical SAM protein [Ancylobacter oerskovii]MBS7544951.1 B12-binding domain-containing radical SAM protein [Ancylobacter oerskovii]
MHEQDVAPTARLHPRVLLVFPRFNPNSFWNFRPAYEMYGARCVAPPLGLMTLAALLPAHWDLRLVDRNAQELADEEILWADLVLTGGMLPQQNDTLAIIGRCRGLGRPVCLGGPDPTSNPAVYEQADFLVLGEAEGIIDRFVEAWEQGARSGRFDAEKFKANVAESPIPRFDLIDFKNYLYVGVQFSRGCPFTCEFCDIIELYGRVPRTKTNEQMLAELDRLVELGYRGHVDFVDDNLIGNKKAIKKFLPELTRWQQRHGYPFQFSTEASLNLADDAELLAMMTAANFFVIFTGIESPDEDTLVAMQKKQNTRRSIAASVERIYEAGIYVTAGFIVGFDTERGDMATPMAACIEDSHIPVAMVGLLHALPNTQLMRRLRREGRLFEDYNVAPAEAGDQCTGGLNFVTLRPRTEILRDYRRVIEEIYAPKAFFERTRVMTRKLKRRSFGVRSPEIVKGELKLLARACWRMTCQRPDIAWHFWKTFIHCARHNPEALEAAMMNMVLYLHLYPFSRHVIAELDARIADMEKGAWREPGLMPAEAEPEPALASFGLQAAGA